PRWGAGATGTTRTTRANGSARTGRATGPDVPAGLHRTVPPVPRRDVVGVRGRRQRGDRMTLFGIDVSHHQGSFDVERAAREGIDFFIFKATEGSGFTDSRFAENVAKARKTGKPF